MLIYPSIRCALQRLVGALLAQPLHRVSLGKVVVHVQDMRRVGDGKPLVAFDDDEVLVLEIHVFLVLDRCRLGHGHGLVHRLDDVLV
jgi:hypothetical protein